MEGDEYCGLGDIVEVISIHSLRMEGDYIWKYVEIFVFAFQSTPSAWRETGMFSTYEIDNDLFQSTPSAWRETSS